MDNNGFCCGRQCCLGTIFTILLALLVGTIGLILGAIFAPIIFWALPAIIVAAVILAILIIIYLIARNCSCRNRR